MKKKTYKRLINRVNSLTKRNIILQADMQIVIAQRDGEKKDKEWYKERLSKIGKNMKTVEPVSGYVRCIKWELDPKQYGEYIVSDGLEDPERVKLIKKKIAEGIARGLMENEIAQFIVRDLHSCDPATDIGFGTVGGKLYVIPWEQMPHDKAEIAIWEVGEK